MSPRVEKEPLYARQQDGGGPTGGPTPGTPAHPTSLLPSKPCGFEATYLELASAVKEEYPGIEIESRLGGTGEVLRAPAESVRVINSSSPAF